MIRSFIKKEEELPVEERATLGKAEQFYLAVEDIPRLKERLLCTFNKERYPLKMLEVKKDIRLLHQATKEIKKSQKVVQLMELLLTIGNFINGGTYRGGAAGFKMDVLLKVKFAGGSNTFQLADVRGNNKH